MDLFQKTKLSDMKTLDRIIEIIFYVIVFFTLIGCSTRKTIQSHEIKTSNKLEVINQPINDKLFISIPEVRTINTDCDSLAQDAVDKFASSIKSEKTSGNNSVKIGFDKEKKAIAIETNVGETKNTEIVEVERIVEVVIVKECSKIVKIFALIGLFSVMFVIYKVVRRFS
jgi:hypothetical protein